MGHRDLTFEIHAPPERVYSLLVDTDRMPEWMLGLKSVTTTAPLDRPGSEATLKFGGPFTVRSRVIATDPGVRHELLSRELLGLVTCTTATTLAPEGDPESGVDRSIDAYGDNAGKTMRALETPQMQLTFFANLNADVQREMLQEAIAESENLPAMITEMSTAWERGDERALEAAVIEETRTEYPELYQMLFLDRNNAWMTELTREMEGSGVDFVAVGAGHIIGRDGLVAQFRARGYRVERVR